MSNNNIQPDSSEHKFDAIIDINSIRFLKDKGWEISYNNIKEKEIKEMNQISKKI